MYRRCCSAQGIAWLCIAGAVPHRTPLGYVPPVLFRAGRRLVMYRPRRSARSVKKRRPPARTTPPGTWELRRMFVPPGNKEKRKNHGKKENHSHGGVPPCHRLYLHAVHRSDPADPAAERRHRFGKRRFLHGGGVRHEPEKHAHLHAFRGRRHFGLRRGEGGGDRALRCLLGRHGSLSLGRDRVVGVLPYGGKRRRISRDADAGRLCRDALADGIEKPLIFPRKQKSTFARAEKKTPRKRSFHRELLKLNFRIALSNDEQKTHEDFP